MRNKNIISLQYAPYHLSYDRFDYDNIDIDAIRRKLFIDKGRFVVFFDCIEKMGAIDIGQRFVSFKHLDAAFDFLRCCRKYDNYKNIFIVKV